MAERAGYEQKNVVQTDLKGLYLQKDEVARLFLIEQEATFEWIHRCILEGGKYRNFVCLGRGELLLKDGEDAEQCPFCAKAAYDSPIGMASRKFVTTVVRYRTDVRGTIVEPVMWEILPWKFPEKTFNNLVAKKEEWGDLREHDIKLTCEVQQYQNFNIEITPNATWKKSEQLAEAITNDFKKNVSPEVFKILGRKLDSKEKAQEVVDRALAVPIEQDLSAAATGEKKEETKVDAKEPAGNTEKPAPSGSGKVAEGGTVNFKKFLDV